ncbi:hypothetical protein J2129_002123 [Methanofollis sp. W23]|uniref:hypothetical protein n=1 Tax=Methanofollis sp. W23 TaxID=2817849 RepID=UPI001AE18DEC|nr:hypothetical protein [Methanofollis sp. W23]MBP2146669.1 hypothetical protein [Methanofollis sp. W23]
MAADDTWEYRWDTSPLGRDLGTGNYTIYAVTADHDLSGNSVDLAHLDGVKHATAPVKLQRPYPVAVLNTSVLQPGDSLLISGTTTGGSKTLSLWIFSQKHLIPGISVPVGEDGTFECVLGPDETTNLSGLSFAVIQHPGANGLFDVKHDPVDGKPYQIGDASGYAIDLGSLTGIEACSAFIDALNACDSDDAYSKYKFFVEAEEWIRIDPIEEAYQSEIVTVTGTADPATAPDLCVKVSPHGITLPGEPGTTPGEAWGEVIVQEGPQNSTWSFSFDTSGWSLGEYTVWVGTSDHNLFHEETFILKYGHVDAACAPLPLIPGKDLTISGNATGGVDNVSIWILGERTIFGENYPKMGESVPVGADQTYTYTLGSEETTNFFSGRYFVIVQHPSYDGMFGVTKTSPPAGESGDFWIPRVLQEIKSI